MKNAHVFPACGRYHYLKMDNVSISDTGVYTCINILQNSDLLECPSVWFGLHVSAMSFWLVREIICVEKIVKGEYFTFVRLELPLLD